MGNELAGKVVLVTGASKGIGASIATSFGNAGASVAIGFARGRDNAERVASEIREAGGRAIAVQGDLAKTADIEAMVAEVVASFGPIDILINNGGVYDFKGLSDIDEAHFHHIFNTNVLGLLTATKIAVEHFNPQGGSVVNISSLSALGNAPGVAVYAASKAAVNAITKVLALELADRRIRVNAIMPGYVDTEGARAIGLKGQRAGSADHRCNAAGKTSRPTFRSESCGHFLVHPRIGLDNGGSANCVGRTALSALGDA